MSRTGFIAILFASAAVVSGQTTQGLISGRLVSTITGRGISGASIEYSSTSSTQSSAASADLSGFYTLPLLSPGTYRVRVNAPGFQSQEVQELELLVAARIELDFRMRPLSDVWEQGQLNSVFLPGSRTIVTFFGPDVDTSRSGSFEPNQGRTGTLESTVSQVIDSNDLARLPLNGRDVYALLVTQAGVTSDGATARGFGLSVNGQRPTASNFLIDGVENNSYLNTGPLATVAPEAIQEYRISTNNFSAEYGRTSGFLANAVTRSGGDRWHGSAYAYFRNEALDANDFQGNLNGLDRPPDTEHQIGFTLGGPLPRRLILFSAYESLHASTSNALAFLTPARSLVDNFSLPGRDSYALIKQYLPPADITAPKGVPGVIPGLTSLFATRVPYEVNRQLAIERVDFVPASGKDRITGRLILVRYELPDFVWTPYPDFISVLNQNTTSEAMTWTRAVTPRLTNEARGSYSFDDLHWNRPHPEVPILISGDGIALPGSPLSYAYKNVNRSGEFLDNVIWAADAIWSRPEGVCCCAARTDI